jgi:uncharacterized membrane protein YeaQ/YmgE (transglycosylase-associated protein family)
MSILIWAMVGIAVWHFAVLVPDRFWGGIVGAFVAAVIGAAVLGFIVSGFTVPGRSETDFAEFLIGIPGCVIGLAASYFYGASKGVEGPKI